jgi:hypothetical protein
MTTTESRPAAAPMIVEPYRAKDIQMAATIDVRTRTVLITGAIDSNDHDILVRVDLPSAGRWQVVKAETNLTDRTWRAWQITFSGGTTVVCDDQARNMCRQFDELYVSDDAERLCFYNGEIRPGEAVLKMFTVDAKASRITMAHNRPTEEEEEEEIEFPIAPDEEEFRDRVRRGFPARAYIEAWLPATVVE